MAKTPCFQCRGEGSIPGQGIRSHMLKLRPVSAKKKNRNILDSTGKSPCSLDTSRSFKLPLPEDPAKCREELEMLVAIHNPAYRGQLVRCVLSIDDDTTVVV